MPKKNMVLRCKVCGNAFPFERPSSVPCAGNRPVSKFGEHSPKRDVDGVPVVINGEP